MLLAYLLVFLAVFSATGYALSCTSCMNSDDFCYGPSMVCPPDNVCASSYTVTTIYESSKIKVFIKSCAPKNQCNVNGTFSIPNGNIKMSITCCNTDNCNPPMPTLPDINPKSNYVTCQTCASTDSSSCYSEQTMQCSGDETMCLLQNTEHYAPIRQSIAIRGCATKSLCDYGTQSVALGTQNMTMTFSCNGGNVVLKSNLLFCVTAMFSVFKLVYSN